MLALAVSASVVILVAWFPVSNLYHQHQQLASATTQLNQLQRQDKALAQEKKKLASPTEIARIAQQQYQLVNPGQQEYQVLPAGGSSAKTSTGSSDLNDPGLAEPVTPSGESELPGGAAEHSHGATRLSPSVGFVGRVIRTLEFWK